MLYVFLVDTGTMIQLDMNLALEKVEYLKGVIARSCSIPPEKQVLLISGGESLDANETVCKYSMGTDTNPIFLFSLFAGFLVKERSVKCRCARHRHVEGNIEDDTFSS